MRRLTLGSALHDRAFLPQHKVIGNTSERLHDLADSGSIVDSPSVRMLRPPRPPVKTEVRASNLPTDGVSAPQPISSPVITSPLWRDGANQQGDLGLLSGVRPGESIDRRNDAVECGRRDAHRLSLKPVHAVIVVLLLSGALCASLTMLVQQGVNYAKISASSSSSSRVQTHGSGIAQQQRAHNSSGRVASSPKTSGSASSSVAGGGTASETPKPIAPQQQSPGSNLIDLNTADIQQLQTINGVGPVMAQRIIDYRASIGRFTSVDQLLSVSGIGPKKLEKIKPQVRVT